MARLARPVALLRGVDAQLALMAASLWAITQIYGWAYANGELHDVAALAAAALAAWMLLIRRAAPFPRHRNRLFRLIARGIGRLGLFLKGLWPRNGVDLLADPPYPRGMPAVFLIAGAAISSLGLLLVVRPWDSGLDLVATFRDVAYPAYLASLALYWVAALAVGLVGLALPFMTVWNYASSAFVGHDMLKSRAMWRGMTGSFVLIVTAMALIPAWAAARGGTPC